MTERDPVVIAGGGPVAMVLALHREGVPFVALETLAEPFVDRRAPICAAPS